MIFVGIRITGFMRNGSDDSPGGTEATNQVVMSIVYYRVGNPAAAVLSEHDGLVIPSKRAACKLREISKVHIHSQWSILLLRVLRVFSRGSSLCNPEFFWIILRSISRLRACKILLVYANRLPQQSMGMTDQETAKHCAESKF